MNRVQPGVEMVRRRSIVRSRLVQLLIALMAAGIMAGCGKRAPDTVHPDSAGNSHSSVQSQEPFTPPEELWELNNQGVAYMEQFDLGGGFPRAVPIFEQIVERWPQWSPGKFNLAVAILNAHPEPQHLERAKKLLREVIAANSNDPHAHYTLGFLLYYQGQFDEARPHFEKICYELKTDDAHSWMRLGDCINDSATGQAGGSGGREMTPAECYERAFRLNPNIAAACYKLSQVLMRSGKPDRAKELRDRFSALSTSLHDAYGNDYIWSGPLAEAIGVKLPTPRPGDKPTPLYEPSDSTFTLADGVRWATADDLAAAGHGGLLGRIRHRFGAGIAAFDYDKDGKLDLFLPASVVRNNKLGDSLWHNDGQGKFTDVSEPMGLNGPAASVGCAVGDFDADHFPDLFITALSGNRLLRNRDGKSFEDVTGQAEELKTDTISISALFIDLDHDSDLDLLVATYGPAADGDRMFREEPYEGGVANAMFMNVGKARPVAGDLKDISEMPPLEVGFRRSTGPEFEQSSATVAFAAADIDNDRDLDLIEVNDHSPCRTWINKRLGRWEPVDLPEETAPSGLYNGAIAGDFNADLQIDLLLARPNDAALLLTNQQGEAGYDEPRAWQAGTTDVSGLRSAQLVDVDFDGWADTVGLGSRSESDIGQVVLGLNRPRGLLARPEWLSGLLGDSMEVQSVLVADMNQTGWPQVVTLRAGSGPAIFQTQGNGNQWLAVNPVGRRERTTSYDKKYPRSNLDGIGTRLIVHSGARATVWDSARLNAGLCQSLLPVVVGLGDRSNAEAVRVRWPSGVEQAELNLPGGQLHKIEEVRRRDTSCPLLFTWNGDRFEFITDFLGGGGIGYLIEPGVYSVPDPDEDVFIAFDQLKVQDDGGLVLKIAEPMDEMTYLDAAWLEVIDHAGDTAVYPDERFDPSRPHASGGRFVFREPIVPNAACDHRGADVLEKLMADDRDTVDAFRVSSMWIGYAEPHYVELEFGRSFQGWSGEERVALFLAGWVEYPYSQTNWAASTAGERLNPPVLKWLNEKGEWELLVEAMGYPAGLPRMMTLDLTGKIPARVRAAEDAGGVPFRIRIETNMEVYWDQIFAAKLEPESQLRTTLLKPASATLEYRGYFQEYTPDGRDPKLFDYHQSRSVPLLGLDGIRTPPGPVRKLLMEDDDQFVLINAGDEVTLRFDANLVPALPSGWRRSYILRTFGYCKDTDLFNPMGRTVEPLPRRK